MQAVCVGPTPNALQHPLTAAVVPTAFKHILWVSCVCTLRPCTHRLLRVQFACCAHLCAGPHLTHNDAADGQLMLQPSEGKLFVPVCALGVFVCGDTHRWQAVQTQLQSTSVAPVHTQRCCSLAFSCLCGILCAAPTIVNLLLPHGTCAPPWSAVRSFRFRSTLQELAYL